MKTAIFPGSFDPFTVGHESIARRALTIFDQLVIAVGINPDKQGLLTPQNRVCLIEDTFAKEPRVVVKLYTSLTAEFCTQMQSTHIIRGLRNSTDMEVERAIETLNKSLNTKLETLYLLTEPSQIHISSSAVRQLHSFGASTKELLPRGIKLDNYL